MLKRGEAVLAFAPPVGRVERIDLRGSVESFQFKVIRRVFEIARDALPLMERPRPALTDQEQSLLSESGLPDRRFEAVANVARTMADFARLLAEALSVAEAARRCQVDPSRIRQRLTSRPPTLLGIKRGNEWLLPRFQFMKGGGELPGLGRIISRLDPELHPLEIEGWLQSPNPDLLAGDAEEPVSPFAWLCSGNKPEVVADLASEL